ncbi:MAG: hypothetical protein P4L51_24810 [Puia sp.]|nr:hypothetical protein [Puia sp.]
MKPTIQLKINARVLSATLLLIASLFVALSSCKKDSPGSTTSSTVGVDDAADAVIQAVTPESAGMVSQTETAALVLNNSAITTITSSSTVVSACGITADTVFAGSNASGAAITYSYSYGSSRILSCKNDIPQQFEYGYTGKWSYDAPRISSNDSANAQLTITGLPADSSQYTFNGSYVRNGSETSKIGNKLSFASTITLNVTNLGIDKNTDEILSGTASVTINGSTSGGKSFSYSGTLTFLGNKQATLVLGSGNTYSITWS